MATYRPLSQQICFGDTTILRIRRNRIDPVYSRIRRLWMPEAIGMAVEGLQAGNELENAFTIGQFGLTRSPCRFLIVMRSGSIILPNQTCDFYFHPSF
ncbi:MAG: hypothetical protein ABSE90_07440 [Verrucomicrobiota bacterium]